MTPPMRFGSETYRADRRRDPTLLNNVGHVRALQARAAVRAADIGPTIKALQEAGATSLRAIAAGLNDQGIPTARGSGKWSAVQVARVLERLP